MAYQILFGVKPKNGLLDKVAFEMLKNISNGIHEEDLSELLEET